MESYLVEGEEILAQAGSFYASNKRLLRYKKHLKGEELDDIPYRDAGEIAEGVGSGAVLVCNFPAHSHLKTVSILRSQIAVSEGAAEYQREIGDVLHDQSRQEGQFHLPAETDPPRESHGNPIKTLLHMAEKKSRNLEA